MALSARPLVSVITPSFNQGRYIRQTLESVAQQSYQPIEHIVMDAGSTDDTEQICRSFPNVQFIKEADFGQSDALNKLFQRAKGEVIAWLNSDDWYEPNAIAQAVDALRSNPVAIGQCRVVEEQKGTSYIVPNFGRSWFDLVKYWIPYSIPTQPAIFFTREVMTGIERRTGEVVDPTLRYTMDYDLWIRLAAAIPFTNRIPAITSNYRMTADNKTSSDKPMDTYSAGEMSLVFRRAESLSGASRQISYIIYAQSKSDALSHTVYSLLTNTRADFEIVLVCPEQSARSLRGFVEELNHTQLRSGQYRFLHLVSGRERSGSMLGCIQEGIERSAGRIISVIPEGAIAATDFSDQLVAAFQDDRIGVVLPFAGHHAFLNPLRQQPAEDPEQLDISFSALMTAPFPFCAFAIRRIAFMEGPELEIDQSIPWQREVAKLAFSRTRSGWHTRLTLPTLLTFSNVVTPPNHTEPSDAERQRWAAELIVAGAKAMAEDPFGPVRAGYRLCSPFSDSLVESAKRVL